MPTKDTNEVIVFTSFFVRGLGLPICSFVWGLLDFYSMNLTHLNPNYVLQIAIFIHLCKAFLGILLVSVCGSTSTIASLV